MGDFETPPNSNILGNTCPPLRRLRYSGMKTVSKEKRPNPVPTKMPKLTRAVSFVGSSSPSHGTEISDQEEATQASQSLVADEWQDSQEVDLGEDVSIYIYLRIVMIIGVSVFLRFCIFPLWVSLRKPKRIYALSYECNDFVRS